MAQQPIPITDHKSIKHLPENKFAKKSDSTSIEICDNNIDDDGNGLTDMKDFACYFRLAEVDTCFQTRILWATFSYSLYRIDLDTRSDKEMNFPSGELYDDISWTPSGKLYGAERWTGGIYEIDPNTGNTKFVSLVPGHYYTNGMGSDAESNLYLSSETTRYGQWDVVKFNPVTKDYSIVATLPQGLESGGDLTFFDNYLYLACLGNKLAKINVTTGAIEIINFTGSANGFGLVTSGDGYLYISSGSSLNRLNPTTWETEPYYTFPRYGYIFGLSIYSEFCDAPGCRSKANIHVESNGPLCSDKGVLLTGSGKGIFGATQFTWTLPDGSSVIADSITAYNSGKYLLNYESLTGECSTLDSIDLSVTEFPSVSLGNDTVLCVGTSMVIKPKNTKDIQSYLWPDGSASSEYLVSQPGLVWVEASNVCGSHRDTLQIITGTKPEVYLGADTLLCPGSAITLKNILFNPITNSYTWSTGSTKDSITVTNPGIYFLQSQNTCGKVVDSIKIIPKDSCICNPIFPLVNLGHDTVLCNLDTILLKNKLHSPGFRYRWQDGSIADNFIVTTPGIYWADVMTYCGSVRDSIIIKQKTQNCECVVYLPDAFTPNKDGLNDTFRPTSNCAIAGEMKIFNRWGTLVYSSSNFQIGWDGFFKNQLQPIGSYLYVFTYKVIKTSTNYVRKGRVLLLR